MEIRPNIYVTYYFILSVQKCVNTWEENMARKSKPKLTIKNEI